MKSLIKIALALLVASGFILSSCNNNDDDNSILISFDSLSLAPNSYWNGSDMSGGFKTSIVSFPNAYNSNWSSWNGFAYSNMHDLKTQSWVNQYSCYAQKDSMSQNTFVLFYQGGGSNTLVFDNPVYDVSLNVCNSTYAALTMKHGDKVSKKFGGADSTENDWFKLLIIGLDESEVHTDTAKVYLADFRFKSKTQDYIVKEWMPVDLSKLGKVKKILFELSSSDNGKYGMNTPGYFCLDNLEYKPVDKTE